jgi:hypothetical protein
MTTPDPPAATCPDRLRLQRWIDGDESLVDSGALAAHVPTCARCQAEVAAIDADRALIAALLSAEDIAAARDARAALAAVRRRLAVGDSPAPRAAAGWRLAPAAAVFAIVALALGVLQRQPLEASAEWLITETQVRQRAWRTRPGKVRVETYDIEVGEPGQAPRRTRRTTWFSTVPGEESSITRITTPSADLVSAMWTRTDGWTARFDTSGGPQLSLDPPTADLEALLPTLPAADAEALRFWLRTRAWRVRPGDQATSQAAFLGGHASAYTRGLGTLVAPPRVQRDRSAYRLSFTVTPHRSPEQGALMTVEDTFAGASLTLEHRLARTVSRQGRLLEWARHRLVTREDADPALLRQLLAEVDEPPPHWKVIHRRLAEILDEARTMWRLVGPDSPAGRQADPSATAPG